MCGIAGYFTKDNINNSIIAEEMIDCMRHRGPDAQGYEVIESNENNLVLAHTRLSIQDLSPLGNQPFINKDKDVFLVFNGEIYNFQDLRKQLILKGYRFTSSSDTEVLLYSYIEWGEDLTNHIKGDFAFCIVDKRINKLLLYRDPLGVKPVYYLLSGDSFVFSSEIKAILRFPGVKKEINKDVLAEYLINGWVYEPDTMFKDIKKLEAGHFIKLNLGDRTFEKIKYFDISSKDSETDLDKLIDKALKYQTISDAPLGLYLSGGVDSSVIAAKVKKTGRIFTLTASMKEDELSYEGFEDDLKYAKEVVNQYENLDLQIVELDYSMIDYYKKLVYYIEEPIADPAIVPAYLLAKKARDKGFKVMLSGMGADELFGGYSRYLAYSKISSIVLGRQIAFIVKTFSKFGQYLLRKGKFLKLFRDLERISNALSKKFPLNYIYLMSYCSEKEVLDLVGSDSVNKFYKKAAGFSELKNLTELQKISYIDLKGFLASHNLIYMDKASMAASVEGRVPLIDIEISRNVFNMPDSFKINNNTLKYGLKQVARKYYSDSFVNRKKAGFTMPVKSWIYNDLRDEIQKLGSGEITKYICSGKICELINQHYAGIKDNAMKIWNLYTLELWLKTFFSEQKAGGKDEANSSEL